ncbi:MAG: hypothetical protein K2H45_12195 [Acetatifactor sp.]|nr:hypothetical protein [Acetatifactor sp.]
MILENEKCRIKIEVDRTYTVDSADNRHYDVTHNPEHYRHSDMTKTLSIDIDLFTSELCIALIGSFYTYDSDCAVLDGEILTVLQNKAVIQIRITDGSIIRHSCFDCFGCNFAIYKVEKGYIIYGEIEITMLGFDLIKKWSFSGKDIFASVSGKTPFELRENSILLYDFEDNRYEIDFNGNQL